MEINVFKISGFSIFFILLLNLSLVLPQSLYARGFDTGDRDTHELIEVLKEKGLLTDEDISSLDSRIKTERDKSSLKIQGRIQARYTNIDDFDTSTDPIRKDANGFRLQRIRLIFKGRALPKVDYFIHLNFDQGTDGHIWDTFIQYTISPSIGHLRLGQFKVPFSRQWLTSSTKFLFMNRANIGDNLGFRRDIGVMFERYSQFNNYQGAFPEGDMNEPTVNYALGIFNGNHRATGNGFLSGSDDSARIGKGNDNDQYLTIGRITYTPIKNKEGIKYLSFGVNGGYQKKPTNGDKFILDDSQKASFDVIAGEPWKFSKKESAWGVDGQCIIGSAIFQAEYIRRKLVTDDLLAFTNGTTARSITADGWFLQGGYFVQPKKLSLNARYETYDPNDQVTTNNDYDRYALGFNYYFQGNIFKLQGDYTWQDEAVNDLDNNYWELQLQMLF